jgi:selenium metabolism protein YedF
MITLDCRGQQCPQPVVQVRKQMLAAPDAPLQVLVSDPAARDNVGRLASSRNYRVTTVEDGGTYRLDLCPGAPVATLAGAPAGGPTVVLVASDQMGSGDPRLGEILLRNFLFTLAETDATPDLLLFINAGAKLTVRGSDVLEPLQKLADLGAEIGTCGLCLEFFGLKDALAIGRVSNMLEVASALQGAGRVIRP